MRKGRFMKYLFQYRYLTLEFEDLDDQLRKYINMFEQEFDGLNVSVPQRESAVYEEDEDEMTKTRRLARERGFTGDICDDCGSSQMVRNGTCLKCNACGSTTGCS